MPYTSQDVFLIYVGVLINLVLWGKGIYDLPSNRATFDALLLLLGLLGGFLASKLPDEFRNEMERRRNQESMRMRSDQILVERAEGDGIEELCEN